MQFLVSAQYRGQQLGYRLLRAATEDIESYAEEMDDRDRYRLIYLHVPISFTAAIALYTRNGFERTSMNARKVGIKSHRMERRIR